MATRILEGLVKTSEIYSLILDILDGFNGFNDNVQMLEMKLEELCCLEHDINRELEIEELEHGKKRKREVENWLRNVKRKKTEVHGMVQELRDCGMFRHLKLNVQVRKLTGQVTDLVARGRFPGGIVGSAQESRGCALLTTELAGAMLQKNVRKIWDWLMNDGVLMIGVYGMGGVGKTSVLMHIHNMLLTAVTNFESVFWVTISKSFSIHKLQCDVAKIVGIDISKESDERKRAARLSRALVRRKRCVLFLDDVWNHFPLERVGIPVRADGLKLVLTSRSLDVCRRMNCKNSVKVEPLSMEEAWTLFVDNLGQQTNLSPEVKQVARSVAKQCAGLPLAIITMARSMRGVEEICEWRHTLEELRNTEAKHQEMEMEVLRVLRFSYDHLNDKIVQQCFLCCALYPEDFEIDRDVLIESFVDEGLVKGMKSLEAMFDEGNTIVNKLENICLLGKVENFVGGKKCMGLQDASSHIAISMMKRGCQHVEPMNNVEGYYVGSQLVKMHDLVRAVAINVIKENNNFLVKAGLQLTKIPDEVEWSEDLEKVSLMCNWIHEIPTEISPRCPKLRTLILKHNESLTRISDSFFVHMSALEVLDLSFTDIEVLPKSVSDLSTLTALLLTSCKRLKHMPSLAKLQALLRLDLSFTAITEMPQGLEMLVNLKWLNLYAKDLVSSGKEVSKLTSLQFLILHWWSRKIKVKVEYTSCLRKLETFAANLYNMQHFNSYVKTMHIYGPRSYLLQLDTEESLGNSPWCCFAEVCFRKDVIISNCKIRTGESPLMLPLDIQRLKVERCHDIRSLCDVMSLKNATSLKRCEIADCDGPEYMFSLSCSSSCCTSLHSLESLELYSLKNLHGLCKEDEVAAQTFPPGRAFTCLKYFFIYHCPLIKKLLKPRLLAYLPNLEEITVHNCKSMEEIISVDGIDYESFGGKKSYVTNRDTIVVTHSKLVSLSLKHLPELKSISSAQMVCESLKNFRIFKCPKLARFPETATPVQILYDSF
ncbi:probable disease resistance protein At4g27220 [Vigna radiata var. radiata]|uniref:Probable disease resistance protein At4g27220 n=1 Tax=Vigna radiata var. radiata TaxID=3916 RepID=A0A1S3W069_VIGRR|nr:probable disease resistance protein At4g27220 [Vigna radiata var. radiata]